MKSLDPSVRRAVLVEGESDRRAVETLAVKLGLDLPAAGVAVLAMGGATNVDAFLRSLLPTGVAISGLVDEAQAGVFTRALRRLQLVGDLADLRFFVCVIDLEDELIRALGVESVRAVLARHQDLAAFELFQRQPDQRGKAEPEQLHRFLGTQSGRKINYGGWLVEALDVDDVPEPLRRLMDSLR